MNKRGISHVEVLLSFLIFVGFVIFALYFFSPVNAERIVDTSTDYLFREIKEESEDVIDSYSISLNLESVVENSVSIMFNGVPSEMQVRVENYKGEKVKSVRETDRVIFDTSEAIYSGNSGFIQIYFSEDILNGEPPDTNSVKDMVEGNNPGEYKLASTGEKIIFSEKRLIDIKNEYELNYNLLKERFNLPSRANFGFRVIFSNGEIIAERGIPEGVEVFVRPERIEILRNTGERVFADILLKVW